jgi:hypothetical protein
MQTGRRLSGSIGFDWGAIDVIPIIRLEMLIRRHRHAFRAFHLVEGNQRYCSGVAHLI